MTCSQTRRTAPLHTLACALLVAGSASAQMAIDDRPPAQPRTLPERSEFTRTSRLRDVRAFLDELRATAPHAARLAPFVFGRSEQGRDLLAVDVAVRDRTADDTVTALVVANIHGGEVEGKEACQVLLREIAFGRHHDLLAHLRLLIVPVFNVDGNERIDATHRVAQNGPAGGVGTRGNADGLDLNRDFVKTTTAEVRALLALIDRHDPDLLLDLHTTNGSHHGYHLTYAPSLSTNVDAGVDAVGRELLAEVRDRMRDDGLRTFDYGILTRSSPRRWITFDHRPRFLTNWFGLRNRIAVLAEAYSYRDFETRIAATHAFVVTVLRTAVAHRAELRARTRSADAACRAGGYGLGFATEPAEPEPLDVLLGSVEARELPGLGTRYAATDEVRSERVGVVRRFVSAERLPAPAFGWAVPAAAVGPPLLDALHAQGIAFVRTERDRPEVAAERFVVEARSRNPRTFQGHRMVTLAGTWGSGVVDLAAGSVLVPAGQRLGRLAAQLLEPQSEDSLFTWNVFDPALAASDVAPVLRLAVDPRR